MAKKKREAVDDLIDALAWMRRKAKKHEPVDDLVDALNAQESEEEVGRASTRRAQTQDTAEAVLGRQILGRDRQSGQELIKST
jgi:hypothetical protein